MDCIPKTGEELMSDPVVLDLLDFAQHRSPAPEKGEPTAWGLLSDEVEDFSPLGLQELKTKFWTRGIGVNSEPMTDCTCLLKTKQRGNDAGS